MLRYIILLLVVIQSIQLHGQQKNADIVLLSKSKKDAIWLRWAPTNPTIWKLGNKYGYNVERFTLRPDGELENQLPEKLNATPVQPLSEQAFNRLSMEVEEASVLAEIIYGEEGKSAVAASRGVLARNQEIENQFGIALFMCDLSPRVAEAGGLFYADKSVTKGKKYIYRISLTYQPKGIQVQPVTDIIIHTDEKPLTAINDLTARGGNQTATLEWKSIFHRGVYSAYYVDKSEDGKNFQHVSELPYVHMTQAEDGEGVFFVDSLETNNKLYYYRISGLSPFGETGPPSNIVSTSGKDNFSGHLIVRDAQVANDNSANLTWEFPAELEAKISGFIVSRSNHPGGPYERIIQQPLQKTARRYSDKSPHNNSYYIVKAVDTQGREVASSLPYLVHLEDNTPPALPANVQGKIDTKGVASLSWNANTDKDILGYRVFRCNSLREEPVEITKEILLKPAYTDSVNVNVLNKKIFYYIVAVDQSYNNSEYSKVFTLNRPDVVPPVAPVFEKAELNGDSINLKWQNSPSDDIAKYQLVRAEKEDHTSRTLFTWTSRAPRESFQDGSLGIGKTYRYKIVVTDSAGNVSERSTGEIRYEKGYRDAITNVRTSVDRDGKKIALDWKNPQPSTRCMIYRKKNDGSLTLYKTINGNIQQFTDTEIAINNIYTYKIQQVFPKGIKSKLSKEIVVKF
jgi:uncharacterized protein